MPVVHRWAYDYSVPGAAEDFIPQNVPEHEVVHGKSPALSGEVPMMKRLPQFKAESSASTRSPKASWPDVAPCARPHGCSSACC